MNVNETKKNTDRFAMFIGFDVCFTSLLFEKFDKNTCNVYLFQVCLSRLLCVFYKSFCFDVLYFLLFFLLLLWARYFFFYFFLYKKKFYVDFLVTLLLLFNFTTSICYIRFCCCCAASNCVLCLFTLQLYLIVSSFLFFFYLLQFRSLCQIFCLSMRKKKNKR